MFFGHAAELADALPGVEKEFIRPPVGRDIKSGGVDCGSARLAGVIDNTDIGKLLYEIFSKEPK